MKDAARSDGIVRREFLGLSILALANVLVQSGCGEQDQSGRDLAPDLSVDRAELLARYFGDMNLASVRLVARVHRGQLEQSGGMTLSFDETVSAISSSGTIEEALDVLDRRVRDDFASGRLVSLEGWQLARTEFDMCMLTLVD